jgi:alpha-tubulin suppressor-like RCC1 family protein
VPSALVAVALLFGPAAACTSILGIDHDYHAAGGDGGGNAAPQFPGDAGAVAKVVAGKFHTCALFASGFAKCWGRNDDYKELGNGSTLSTSVPLPAMSSGLNDLFAGAHQTCATVEGGAVCAGLGENGELGNGGNASSAVPVNLVGFPSAPTAIVSGETFMCALVATGEVWCVGAGMHGELGDGTARMSVSPVRAQLGGRALAVAAYYGHACAVIADGTVECWGDDSFGQLGNGHLTPDGGAALPSVVPGIAGATAVGVGAEHSCALVGAGRTSGVWCWGGNGNGQLGTAATAPSPTPVQVQGLEGATSLAVGGFHACAGMLVAGVVKCWGKGGSGELGNGRSGDAPTPVTVQSISYPESLAAGGYHTCALVASPNVVCWGSNDFGQLGNGNAPNQQNQPVQVTW